MGWKLEAFRMALYVSIPVLAFHIFNNPVYFEKYVIAKKRELYPPVDEERIQRFRDMKAEFRQLQKERIEAELKAL